MRKLLIEFVKLLLEARPSFHPGDRDLTPQELINYVKKFPYVAEGTSRRVYMIRPNKAVMKVARNRKGMAQNKEEATISINAGEASVVLPKVFDYDKKQYTWIIVEFVREFGRDDAASFEKMTGVSYIDFRRIVVNYYRDGLGKPDWDKIEADLKSVLKTTQKDMPHYDKIKRFAKINFYRQNDFLKHILYLMSNFALEPNDLQLKHFGTSASGNIVLLDYGYTTSVYMKHYSTDQKRLDDQDFDCRHPEQSIDSDFDEDGYAVYTCTDCNEDVETYTDKEDYVRDLCRHEELVANHNETTEYSCKECGTDIPDEVIPHRKDIDSNQHVDV